MESTIDRPAPVAAKTTFEPTAIIWWAVTALFWRRACENWSRL